MRNFLFVAGCAAALWFSYTQAQLKLGAQSPLPADRGVGEAKTQLELHFTSPFPVKASELNGPLAENYDEVHGRYSFTQGRLIRAAEADRLLRTQSATVCEVFAVGDLTEGELTSQAVRFKDFVLDGRLSVQDIFYQQTVATNRGLVTATIPIEIAASEFLPLHIRALSVRRSYHGGGLTVEQIQNSLTITPQSLKECFGAVEVNEVPAKR